MSELGAKDTRRCAVCGNRAWFTIRLDRFLCGNCYGEYGRRTAVKRRGSVSGGLASVDKAKFFAEADKAERKPYVRTSANQNYMKRW